MSVCTQAYGQAIKYLSHKPYHSQEMRRKLMRQGYEDPDPVMQKLVEQGYLDDEAYLEMLIRTYISKAYSPMQAQQKVLEKGIDRAQAQYVFEVLCEQEVALAKRALRKTRSKHPLDALVRKGFSYHASKQALSDSCVPTDS